MDQVEFEFLKTQQSQPLMWTHGQQKLEELLDNFNKFYPNLRFTHEFSGKNVTYCYVKQQIDTSISITHRYTLTILNGR